MSFQGYVKKIFETIEEGKDEDTKKLLSCKKYHYVRDKSGRTLIHRAVKRKRKAIAMYLAEECPENLLVGDTVSYF